MSFTLLFSPVPSILFSVFRSSCSLFYLNLCQAYLMPLLIPCLKDVCQEITVSDFSFDFSDS